MKKKPYHNIQPDGKTSGSVRIIGGIWRGRKLPVLNASGLRPTGDRIKETLFNWLMGNITDSVCLDCFSGSGSLGFEGLSRGAKQAVFLELNPLAAKQLQKNLQLLKCNNAEVIVQDTLKFLKLYQNQPHFDLVFVDPPFHLNLATETLTLLHQNNWLKPQALIYVETEKDHSVTIPPTWQLLKEKTTGQVNYRLYRC